MDECSAALVLMSLSCSPHSPNLSGTSIYNIIIHPHDIAEGLPKTKRGKVNEPCPNAFVFVSYNSRIPARVPTYVRVIGNTFCVIMDTVIPVYLFLYGLLTSNMPFLFPVVIRLQWNSYE